MGGSDFMLPVVAQLQSVFNCKCACSSDNPLRFWCQQEEDRIVLRGHTVQKMRTENLHAATRTADVERGTTAVRV